MFVYWRHIRQQQFSFIACFADEVITSATAAITSDDEDDAEEAERNGGGGGLAKAELSSKDIDQDDDEDSAEGSADRMLVF